MTAIDFNNTTAHVIIDRKARFEMIERTIGWGNPVIVAPDKKERDATATLTDTGVMIIRDFENKIITAWVASVAQAQAVYGRATGSPKLPRRIWLVVNYNNNTPAWNKLVAA